jgi:hypothetical protein
MMTVTRRSALSGTFQTMEINITNGQLLDFGNDIPLPTVAPQLTAAERRFLETGITPEEDAALTVLD